MTWLFRFLFFNVMVRTVVLLVLGLHVRHRERLPDHGPALIVANHNSHLDTLVLMMLFPERVRRIVRPVAAADYFLRNKLIAWFALRIIGIIPIARKGTQEGEDVLAGCAEALERDQIVIIFPEGSRGEPEQMTRFRSGVARLAERHPDTPVVPVFLHGLGKSLPKGTAIFVPFFCDVVVGESVFWTNEFQTFMNELNQRMTDLADELHVPSWE